MLCLSGPELTRFPNAARSVQAELQINVVSIYLQFNDEASVL